MKQGRLFFKFLAVAVLVFSAISAFAQRPLAQLIRAAHGSHTYLSLYDQSVNFLGMTELNGLPSGGDAFAVGSLGEDPGFPRTVVGVQFADQVRLFIYDNGSNTPMKRTFTVEGRLIGFGDLYSDGTNCLLTQVAQSTIISYTFGPGMQGKSERGRIHHSSHLGLTTHVVGVCGSYVMYADPATPYRLRLGLYASGDLAFWSRPYDPSLDTTVYSGSGFSWDPSTESLGGLMIGTGFIYVPVNHQPGSNQNTWVMAVELPLKRLVQLPVKRSTILPTKNYNVLACGS